MSEAGRVEDGERLLAAARQVEPSVTGSQYVVRMIGRVALVVGAFALLGVVTDRVGQRLVWLIPAVLCFGAIWFLGRGLRVAPAAGLEGTLLLFCAGLLALGGLLMVGYFLVVQWSWLLLLGLALGLVALAAIESLLRYVFRTSRIVPIVLAVVCVGLVVLGAVVADRSDAVWPILVYLAAAVVAYLAMTFGADPWICTGPAWAASWRAIAGGLVAAIGVALITQLGGEAQTSLTIALVAIAVTTLIVIDADAVLFLLLVFVALLWAIIPRGVDRTPIEVELAGPDGSADHALLVAMGDSYMSGEGARRFESGTNVRGTNTCRRSLTTHAELFADARGDDLVTVSVACSGADIIDIDNPSGRGQHDAEPIDWPFLAGGADQLTQLGSVLGQVDVDRLRGVYLSVGGNDAGFSEVGLACVGAGDCSEIGDVWLAELPVVRTRLSELYTAVRSELDTAGATDVPVIAVGYPVSITPEGCTWTWLSDDEHGFVTDFIERLDATVALAAADADIEYMHTIPGSFEAAGVRLCEAGFWDGGLNFVALNPMEGSLLASLDPRNWLNNSFHPNEDGHRAMLVAAEEWWTGYESGEVPPAPTGAVASVQAPCEPEDCDAFVAEWARGKLLDRLRAISIPVLVMFGGAWLAATGVVHRWRKRSPGPPTMAERVVARAAMASSAPD